MRVLIASPLAIDAIEELRSRHDVLCVFNDGGVQLPSTVEDRDVIVVRSGVHLTRDVLEAARNLSLIVRAGCGLDNIDVECARSRGVAVVPISAPAADAVAELAVGLMFCLARRIVEADTGMRAARWEKAELAGHLLVGKTVGIVGAGNIGGRVGALAHALGMRAIGCVEHPGPQAAARLERLGVELRTFHQVIAESDFVSVHVPLTPSTAGLIDGDALARMRPTSYLLNLARGGVVDELALLRSLEAGALAGAALDVHEQEGPGTRSPLAELPNVVLTPHVGSMAAEAQHRIGRLVVQTIDEFDDARVRRAATLAGSPGR